MKQKTELHHFIGDMQKVTELTMIVTFNCALLSMQLGCAFWDPRFYAVDWKAYFEANPWPR